MAEYQTLEPPSVVSTIIEPARKKARVRINNKKTGTKRRRQTIDVENANFGSWLTIISNLVLLVAIFAIIFSAQRALHNNKDKGVLVPQPVATAVEQAVAEEKESGQQGAVSGEQSPPEADQPSAEATSAPALEKETAAKVEPKQATKKRRHKHDPFTSGGPLDLDRASGQRDPWNAGGAHDLDSETARTEYKKSYLSSSDSDK